MGGPKEPAPSEADMIIPAPAVTLWWCSFLNLWATTAVSRRFSSTSPSWRCVCVFCYTGLGMLAPLALAIEVRGYCRGFGRHVFHDVSRL